MDRIWKRRIWMLIESAWKDSNIWPDFIEIMRQALSTRQSTEGYSGNKFSSWVQLPGLCCQAAGGYPEWSDDITAAWLLFYTAAHIMDSVEDQDAPDPWWAGCGPGVALNTATGLYFSASKVLNHLYSQDLSRLSAPEIVDQFQKSFLSMSSGQHRDLIHPQRSLEQYWEIANAKSGAFFSLACYSGARLAISDPERLQAYQSFGCHLGLVIQILDDLDEFQHPIDEEFLRRIPGMRHSLPIVYALEVLPEPVQSQLKEVLGVAPASMESARQTLDLIEASGAALYMAAEMERHRSMALEALSQAAPLPPAGQILADIVQSL